MEISQGKGPDNDLNVLKKPRSPDETNNEITLDNVTDEDLDMKFGEEEKNDFMSERSATEALKRMNFRTDLFDMDREK